ncbi:unnamed protein product, partial [Mesorhabditis belari]|uniref:chitin synthase n=1 Tax=Mesorhabditis belari TaxID=2138241 RepID=A0AAF3EUD0_9BILA
MMTLDPSRIPTRHHSNDQIKDDQSFPKQDTYYFTTGGGDSPGSSTQNPPISAHEEANQIRENMKNKEYEASSFTAIEAKGWDIFRLLPPPPDKLGHGFWHDASLQVLKLGTFVVLFALTLITATVSKTTFLLMTSAIGWAGKNMTICNDRLPEAPINTVVLSNKLVVKWVWAVYFAVIAPEVICFIRSFHRTLFRNVKRPTIFQFVAVFVVETLHALGVGTLVFLVLPDLDGVTAAMLTNAVCFVPAIMTLLSRSASKLTAILVLVDIGAIAAQSSGFWAYSMLLPSVQKHAVTIPVCLTLISLAWWQNFVSTKSIFPPIRALARFASHLSEKRSKTYAFVSIWKMIIYLLCVFFFIGSRMPHKTLFHSDPFESKLITITGHSINETQIQSFLHRMEKIQSGMPRDDYDDESERSSKGSKKKSTKAPKDVPDAGPVEIESDDYEKTRRMKRAAAKPEEEEDLPPLFQVYDSHVELNMFTTPYDAFWMWCLQMFTVVMCYQSSKFACKVMMQRLGFALPMVLSVPCTVLLLTQACEFRRMSACHMVKTLGSRELFWSCPRIHGITGLFSSTQAWIWLAWLISQVWVTIHLWNPKHERLAKSEKLFILPYYAAAFVDQSLAFNRRRDDKAKIKAEDLDFDNEDSSLTYETIPGNGGAPKAPPSVCSHGSSRLADGLIRDAASTADAITKIYACATMWHETAHEMTCMLKSIFRMDEDQCARRNAQKYFKVIDSDYYEFEAHIFIDDAYETNEYGEPVINKFVKQFVEVVDQAASCVHQTQMRLKPPKKIKTPYGGKLSYILPGKNKMVVHLKDKNKIRHRKRWSQVMYLYYLLGYRLMCKVEEQNRKEVISENTFILTLDGDVDFQPACVHLLVDLMKKNRRLGAACGRIHPRGSGLMVWYQKFEYAVGHWLQKATEHMIGCVLCSPGCFSLFRSYALMDDNVTRRYASKSDQPLDYIQYDQGEDRWLCTLLLQRGYRVEYCAASDALTFAPEGFNEFFNQRRRWIPSTIANIMDLLKDYKNVVRVNESISIWYIIYQVVMLISSILGPGTIFLMIVGAISISFTISTNVSLLIVTVPVILFIIVCLVCTQEKQLLVAQVIGALFAMLMTAVIVGTSLQIQKDGIFSPHSMFLFAVITSFLTAAILHPLEFTCIIPGVLYFLAIPCMYMLLPIYSICNLNTVTWGTREDPRPEEKNDLAKRGKNAGNHHLDIVDNGESTSDGAFSLGCGSACRLLCCLKPDPMETSPQVWRINEKLNEITRKMDKMERRTQPGLARRASILSNGGIGSHGDKCSEMDEDDQGELDDDLEMSHQSQAAMKNKKWRQQQSESWLNDKALRRAEREYLDPDEEQFWLDVIDKYLHPLNMETKEQDRVRAGLGELRNKVTSGFLMLNIVFIIVVLVLQLQKDCLHIEWPFGPRKNHTFIPCHGDTSKEITVMSRLQLEPIGLVFLVFFMSILVIQFFAMLFHRFGTLAHIIASTELFCFRKPVDRLSEDDLVVQNAVEIARELQAIKGVDEPQDGGSAGHQISRRNVVQNLESSRRSMMKRKTETLDAAFKKRFFALNSDNQASQSDSVGFASREKRLTLRKGTIRALEQRRESVFGTLDRRGDNPYNSDNENPAQGVNNSARGPSQRRLERLDRIFTEGQTGGGSSNSTVVPMRQNNAPKPIWTPPTDQDSRRF